jgi:hypothetical protein
MANDITKHENKDAMLIDFAKDSVVNLTEEYQGMIAKITEQFPSVRKSSLNFYKKSSQFKTSTLDLTAITPLRTCEQLLALIDQTKEALVNAYLDLDKSIINAKIEQRAVDEETDVLKKELLAVELKRAQYNIANSEQYIKGALRTMAFATAQYENVMTKIGMENLTEDDYEKNEYRHHIMTSFKQALTAARSNNGNIDEGNHIYLFELGINGAVAQVAINNYLQAELNMMQQGTQPTHKMTLDWLEACANEFENNPEVFAAWRGMTLKEKIALHKG